MRRTFFPLTNDPAVLDRASDLTARAHRLRRKGELRRAVVAFREACALEERHPALWLWLGDTLARMGRRYEAERAMKQALFLRERSAETGKANVIRGLLLQLALVR
ncbi:MAG TPA: hypothetical protein VK540_08280 [Polyangiaceae bacterium]|nr:hypothetical protein [Polyangiaceae bacterium]